MDLTVVPFVLLPFCTIAAAHDSAAAVLIGSCHQPVTGLHFDRFIVHLRETEHRERLEDAVQQRIMYFVRTPAEAAYAMAACVVTIIITTVKLAQPYSSTSAIANMAKLTDCKLPRGFPTSQYSHLKSIIYSFVFLACIKQCYQQLHV